VLIMMEDDHVLSSRITPLESLGTYHLYNPTNPRSLSQPLLSKWMS
jgi:hypothetical protein